MKFTETEFNIILHRLVAPEAIAEVLMEERGYYFEDVQERVYEIEARGAELIDFSSKLDMAIIQDCCEGCTFFCDINDAIAHGEISKGKAMAYFKAAQSLEEKLGFEVIR